MRSLTLGVVVNGVLGLPIGVFQVAGTTPKAVGSESHRPTGCHCRSHPVSNLSKHEQAIECHGLDTPERVCFYEQDFYVLSNFSAFRIRLLVDDGSGGEVHCSFDTSEAAYHWFKFPNQPELQARIRAAQSAHDAFKLAEQHRDLRRSDWDDVKVGIMHDILRAKVDQHEYVRRKLLATGTRQLVENSWRDDFWGWGPTRAGQNVLGKLWMEIREELQRVR